MDSVASIIICLFIVKAAYDIFAESMNKLVDHSYDMDQEEVRKVVLSVSGVKGIDLLQSRMFGSKFFVDLEIRVDGTLSLIEAHRIAEEVHLSVEDNFTSCKHCMVHVNPDKIKEN